MFHMSQLKKCLSDTDTVIDTHYPEVQPNPTYVERPVKILDTKEKVLKTKTINYVKFLWSGQTKREATRELEDDMKQKYPELFS